MCFQLEHRQVGKAGNPPALFAFARFRAMYVFGFELQLILLLEHICNAERTPEPQPAQKTSHTAGSKPQGWLPGAAFRDNKEREMDTSLHRLFLRHPPVPLIAGSGRVNFFPSSHTV